MDVPLDLVLMSTESMKWRIKRKPWPPSTRFRSAPHDPESRTVTVTV
jgi:hypothetical protein